MHVTPKAKLRKEKRGNKLHRRESHKQGTKRKKQIIQNEGKKREKTSRQKEKSERKKATLQPGGTDTWADKTSAASDLRACLSAAMAAVSP
jgi:hypothetical protein